jgi:formylglycine-generating enzyme required for sulfatase activity
MHFGKYHLLIITLIMGILGNAHASVPVPYAGKVSIDGVNFDGQLKFMFAIYTSSNDMVWDSGSDPIEVPVSNGRYLVLLGGQGMRPLPASLFHENDELYVGVYADLPNDNVGQVKLGELQRITAQPYALVAEMAKIADVANSATSAETAKVADSAKAVEAGAITTSQLNEQILKYLKPEITHSPQAPGLIFGGQTVTLLSQAEGKYLSYQWHKNGQPIAGATGDRYVIEDINKTQHDGNYSLVVSNDFGTVTTPTTTIDVNGTPTTHTVPSANNLEMIFCPPGTFMMGSPTTETGRGGDETQHQVTLTNGFYLGKFEVTQAQYEAVMTGNPEGLNADPSHNNHKGINRPVDQVSWHDIQVFLSRLNDMEEAAGRLPAGWKYALPTEAQWEYACRAGTTTRFSWGNDINSTLANYNRNINQTVNVGQYYANPWGFFDMHGNVWEWVYDWKADYPGGSLTNPEGPASASIRVLRGGNWNGAGTVLRSARRHGSYEDSRTYGHGFRLAFQAIPADSANPEIFLEGNTNLSHSQGLPFSDPGVEAHDARDGNITDQIVVTGTVDMNSTGTYLLTYTVQDGAGNSATATRTVTVVGNRTVDLNATVAMDMIWCPPGTFTMGSPTTEAGRHADETEHNVSLTHGFYLGKYEVTQAQYEAVMTGVTGDRNATPSHFHGYPNRPVEMVSWDDAQVFLTRLNEQQAGNLPAGWNYVLPTESQWEYACRAGTTTAYSWGDGIASTNANYNASGYSQTRDVGLYAANPWGLFDMHGNVWEWVNDWKADYPTGNPVVDPTGPASASKRAERGGSWYNLGNLIRSAGRNQFEPGNRTFNRGFRVSLKKSQ